MEENVEKIPCIVELTEDTPILIKDIVKVPIEEGINVRYERNKNDKNKLNPKVSFTDSHENGVNTSLRDNPSISTVELDGVKNIGKIKVYSIFKRTPMNVKNGSSDGNPLVYAFKGEKGYQFESDVNKDKLQQRINDILKKFLSSYFQSVNGEVITLLCPSGNPLNGDFAKWVGRVAQSMNKNIRIFDDVFMKISTDEIREEVIEDPRSYFNSWIFDMTDEEAEKKKSQLNGYLDLMDKEHSRLFSYHYVRDSEIRDKITRTMNDVRQGYDFLNGSNILLLDDTISKGKTLKGACNILCTSYVPKTITCLTLFSELKKTV